MEYAEYVGNYYGTPSQFVNEQRDKGIHVILEIEMQGALKVKEKARDSKLVFILPPSANELKSRLVGRGTETEAVIAQRLKRAAEETSYIDSYEYYVVNDDLQECVEDIRSILDDKFDNKLEEGFIANIKKEICVFSKGYNMLHPSYTDLMAVVNSEVEAVNSRLFRVDTLSLWLLQRARQIIAGEEPMVDGDTKKPLSVAVDELYHSQLKIIGDEDEE